MEVLKRTREYVGNCVSCDRQHYRTVYVVRMASSEIKLCSLCARDLVSRLGGRVNKSKY